MSRSEGWHTDTYLLKHRFFGDLFLILFQNEKEIIEMSVDIHHLINSVFLRLTIMCHKKKKKKKKKKGIGWKFGESLFLVFELVPNRT